MFVCRPELVTETRNECGFHLMSDLHIGSPQTEYSLIEQELVAARERGDRILIDGDVFDAILTRDLKRYSPDGLHPRLQGTRDILGMALDWATELLSPYAALIDLIAVGNHDDTPAKQGNIDLVRLLVGRLNTQGGKVWYGGYSGFVDYKIRFAADGSLTRRFVIFYHHGVGGGSSLAGNASDANKFSWVEGADLIWLGHKHQKLNLPVGKVSCPVQGHHVKERSVRFVRTGAYMTTWKGEKQKHALKHGRASGYGEDAGYAPHGPDGRGGVRVTLKHVSVREGYRILVQH
jgi:hypothetical protein